MREVRLRWFRHVRRRPQSALVRRVESLVVDGLRRRGRPKLRWEDRVKNDMKELLLSEGMTSDRNEWRARISFFRLVLALRSCGRMLALCFVLCVVVYVSSGLICAFTCFLYLAPVSSHA
ncbi:hypothetical protein Tco_1364243, partial [Tanacetum coccineum]